MHDTIEIDEVGPGAPGTLFVCALCGTRFTHARQVCSSCPLHAGCRLVSCPSCGYAFPRNSLVVDWIRRLGFRCGWSPR